MPCRQLRPSSRREHVRIRRWLGVNALLSLTSSLTLVMGRLLTTFSTSHSTVWMMSLVILCGGVEKGEKDLTDSAAPIPHLGGTRGEG